MNHKINIQGIKSIKKNKKRGLFENKQTSNNVGRPSKDDDTKLAYKITVNFTKKEIDLLLGGLENFKSEFSFDMPISQYIRKLLREGKHI